MNGKHVKGAETKRIERKLVEADVGAKQRRDAEKVARLIERVTRVTPDTGGE